MKATSQPNAPVAHLLDELVDGLHLLYECRRRGVDDVDRLLEYLEYTMDEIERHHLGMSGELFLTLLSSDESEALLQHDKKPTVSVLALPERRQG